MAQVYNRGIQAGDTALAFFVIKKPTSDPGPYSLGETEVILTLETDGGLIYSCEATVTVIDTSSPEIRAS